MGVDAKLILDQLIKAKEVLGSNVQNFKDKNYEPMQQQRFDQVQKSLANIQKIEMELYEEGNYGP